MSESQKSELLSCGLSKWTSELPKENGMYAVYIDSIGISYEWLSVRNGVIEFSNESTVLRFRKYQEENRRILWCKFNLPPLPKETNK